MASNARIFVPLELHVHEYCLQASDQLKEMYRIHKARTFMRRLTPEDKTHVRIVGQELCSCDVIHCLLLINHTQNMIHLRVCMVYCGPP